jgi:hypothetical protein
MDTDQLKSKIREALGAAGIGREIAEQVDRIIDSASGQKHEAKLQALQDDDDERKAKVQSQQAQLRTQPARGEREVPDDDDEAPRSVKAAESRAKPARKTKTARKKK